MKTDREIQPTCATQLYTTRLEEFAPEAMVIDYGAILLCKGGSATIGVDFKMWPLCKGAVITLFPNDVVQLHHATDDFEVELLRYDPALLREASLQLEQTVYSSLRKDRCRHDSPAVTHIVEAMFSLLRAYFDLHGCRCTEQQVLYQLKAFFLGFYDWISLHQVETADDSGSRRVNELFNLFMQQLECHYRDSHDVAFYAQLLNITPKYLCTIVQRKTQHTPKVIIDHYVILQVKLTLRTSDRSIKQIAWDYHFSDVSFFCRYFKQHTRLTPQQFRQQNSTHSTIKSNKN